MNDGREVTVDLSDFLGRARAFLANHPRRSVEGGGDGEAVRLFPERESGDAVNDGRSWLRTRFDAGFGFIRGPPDLGGAGLAPEHAAAYAALEAEFVVPDTTAFAVSIGVVAPTVLDWGSKTQRLLVPRLHRGDLVACQLFSEPDAGSDLASVTTRAIRDGSGWRLSGAKVWTSGAHYADIGEVLCSLPALDDARSRHARLTMFLLDMTSDGVEVRPLRQMTGGSSFNEVRIDDVYVRDEDRLGPVGDGWGVALATLAHERSGADVGPAGSMSRTAARLIERAKRTAHLSSPYRDRVTDAFVRERVLRCLIDRASHSTDDRLRALVKLGLTEHLRRTADAAAGVIGPDMVACEHDCESSWTELVLSVPGVRLAGGSDEIQRNLIAERMLGLPP